jgi:hypothetical protein
MTKRGEVHKIIILVFPAIQARLLWLSSTPAWPACSPLALKASARWQQVGLRALGADLLWQIRRPWAKAHLSEEHWGVKGNGWIHRIESVKIRESTIVQIRIERISIGRSRQLTLRRGLPPQQVVMTCLKKQQDSGGLSTAVHLYFGHDVDRKPRRTVRRLQKNRTSYSILGKELSRPTES